MLIKKPVIEILWTGGFDSSFRVTQLSMLPVIIQPYYLSDHRPSENKELNAIEEISKLIKHKPETRCELLSLKMIQSNERIISKEVTDAYFKITRKHHLGSQYEFLGSFATEHPGIEIGINDWSGFHNKFGSLTKVTSHPIGEYFIYDLEHSPKELHVLFQNYHFPIAFMTKLDIMKNYLKLCCEDVMNLTWFCFTPINGLPCGMCTPCRLTIEGGVKARFSNAALRRYWTRKYFSPLLKFESRIIKIIKRVIRKIRSYCQRRDDK